MKSALLSESCQFWFQVEGSELKKIRTNSRVYQRYYLLDTGLQALCWEPSKKESDKARISLDSIREVGVVSKSKVRKHIRVFQFYRIFSLLWSLILGADGSQHGNFPHQRSL